MLGKLLWDFTGTLLISGKRLPSLHEYFSGGESSSAQVSKGKSQKSWLKYFPSELNSLVCETSTNI
jgi:hypothetical protein